MLVKPQLGVVEASESLTVKPSNVDRLGFTGLLSSSLSGRINRISSELLELSEEQLRDKVKPSAVLRGLRTSFHNEVNEALGSGNFVKARQVAHGVADEQYFINLTDEEFAYIVSPMYTPAQMYKSLVNIANDIAFKELALIQERQGLYAIKCLNPKCKYKTESKVIIEVCPECGGTDIKSEKLGLSKYDRNFVLKLTDMAHDRAYGKPVERSLSVHAKINNYSSGMGGSKKGLQQSHGMNQAPLSLIEKINVEKAKIEQEKINAGIIETSAVSVVENE